MVQQLLTSMAFVGRPALGVRVLRCFSAVMRPGSLEPARQPIRFCGLSPVTAGSGQPKHWNVGHDLQTRGRPGRKHAGCPHGSAVRGVGEVEGSSCMLWWTTSYNKK